MKKSLNSYLQQFHQYQQRERTPNKLMDINALIWHTYNNVAGLSWLL